MLFFSLSSVLSRLYLLRKPIHTGIALLAERYGPVFSLQFGSREAVVVSSAACMRRECFF